MTTSVLSQRPNKHREQKMAKCLINQDISQPFDVELKNVFQIEQHVHKLGKKAKRTQRWTQNCNCKEDQREKVYLLDQIIEFTAFHLSTRK